MNLSNKRFGKLTCLEKSEKKRYWICKCDCGNTKEIRDNHLTLGLTKTCCECVIFELPGKKVNKLKVIEYVSGGSRHRKFRCICDCGNETTTSGHLLMNGYVHSCGKCTDKIWKIGEKFGYLRVLEYHSRHRSNTKWKCQCDCGTIKIIDRNNLVTGHIQSCGCKRFIEGSHQGERGRVNILTEKDVIQIRKFWAEELVERKATGEYVVNHTHQSLADRYHVSQTTIHKVLHSRTWFFLPSVEHYIENLR